MYAFVRTSKCKSTLNCTCCTMILYSDSVLCLTHSWPGEGYSSHHLSGSWVAPACWGGRAWPLRTFWGWLRSAGALCACVARWTGSWVETKQQEMARLHQANSGAHMLCFFKSCYATFSGTEVAEVTDVHSHTYIPPSCDHEVNLKNEFKYLQVLPLTAAWQEERHMIIST